ncbi:biotin/lipoate A/B protein ligase family protein [Thermotoga sp. SG1]|uniref:lipoate--protein ligase family protein n=1 Tax=Thermotoga sp. SG1 TaxID=126739 RepID=UPI000C77EB23|nr:biotin/lipoate A/B protein ligase family protein [Thermotoga sp. SG1]PLV56825.1 biotin--protein ligase [Thermotoga sp. SG1]
MIEKGVFPGSLNMAIDSLMAKWVWVEKRPFFRIYGWKNPTVSLGRFQKEDGLRIPEGVDFVRRPSGGRAVLHHMEITYCLAVPRGNSFGELSVLEFHRLVHSVIKDALRELGVPAVLSDGKRGNTAFCFDASSKYEIVVDGMKIVGSAQFRTKNAIVEHGSIVLKQSKKLLREIFGESVLQVGGLLEMYDVDVVLLEKTLVRSFEKLFGPSVRIQLSDDMLKEAHELSGFFEMRRR